jgi:PhnB protein
MPEAKHVHNTLQPYLIVRNCATALEFYSKAFGATERMRMDRSDGRIGHAEIQVGATILMMADEHPEVGAFSPEHYGGSSVSFHFYVEDCDAAFERAIAAGAKTARAPEDQPYGERNAGVLDPFGYKWWIASPLKTKPQKTSERADGVHVDGR